MSPFSPPDSEDLVAQRGMNVVCYTQPMTAALARGRSLSAHRPALDAGALMQ